MIVKSLECFTHTVIMTYDLLHTCCLNTVLIYIIVLPVTLDTDVLYRDFDMLSPDSGLSPFPGT